MFSFWVTVQPGQKLKALTESSAALCAAKVSLLMPTAASRIFSYSILIYILYFFWMHG